MVLRNTTTEKFTSKQNKYFLFCKSVTGILILILFALNTIFLCVTIFNSVTIYNLRNQVYFLQHDVNNLEYRLSNDKFLKDFAGFVETYKDDSYYDSDNYYNKDYYNYSTEKDKSLRTRREVVGATLDGVPIITESYAEEKRRNKTLESLRLYESLGKKGLTTKSLPSSTTLPPNRNLHRTFYNGWAARTYGHHERNDQGSRDRMVMSRASRVMHTDEDKTKTSRKVFKKSANNKNNRQVQEHVESTHVIIMPSTTTPANQRSHRQGKRGQRRNLETLDEDKTHYHVTAGHFYGNTSHYTAGKRHGYRGNGHLAHPQGLFLDWHVSDWMHIYNTDQFLPLQPRRGEVIVRDAGLYFIYAQIYYVDEHDLNGFQILSNDVELAQCTTMTHTERKIDKRNTCWTGTLASLSDGDRISLRDIETHRYVYFAHAKSFFGLYKLADLNIHTRRHTIK